MKTSELLSDYRDLKEGSTGLITIAIPIVAFDRLQLLEEEIESIKRGIYQNFKIVVVVDGNAELYEAIRKKIPFFNDSILLNEKRKGWIASINRIFKEFDSAYYIYASDDLVFPPDCIEKAMATMKEKFPDGYGIVTLGRKHKAIFGLIGNKWVEQFPDRQVFCPYYIHYGSDPEHTAFAHKIEKYAFPPDRESQVLHHRLNDGTRRFSRKSRTKDLALYQSRKARNRIWGINFDR